MSHKITKISDEEYEIIKKHTINGEKVLGLIDGLKKIRISVRHHHERWDGEGYPDGLKGNEISLESQIISVADAYDAMSTDRPYRKALSKEKIMNEFKENYEKQFSPLVCEKFIEMLENEEIISNHIKIY